MMGIQESTFYDGRENVSENGDDSSLFVKLDNFSSGSSFDSSVDGANGWPKTNIPFQRLVEDDTDEEGTFGYKEHDDPWNGAEYTTNFREMGFDRGFFGHGKLI